jgi:hypothetical protein
MIYTKSITEKINALPIDIQHIANDFINVLYNKYNIEKSNSEEFAFNWAGGLSDLKDKYTSIELQKNANEWRGNF